MKNIINWFEIPSTDFERAKKFYETVMGFKIQEMKFGDWKMGLFAAFEGKVSGAIMAGPGYEPTEKGALLYLNGNPDLTEYLNRVEAAGGKITVPKKQISPEIGYYACFIDTEGNRLAFHSQS